MKVLYVLLLTFALAYAQSINGSASGGIGANGTGGQIATEIQGGNPPKNGDQPGQGPPGSGNGQGQSQPGGNGQGQGQAGGNGQAEGGGQGQIQGQIGGGNGQGGGGSFSGSVSANGLGQGILSALDGIAGGFVKGVQSLAEPFVTAENAICVGLDNVMADLIRNGNYSGQNYVFSVGGKVVSQGQIRGGNKRKSNTSEKLKALKDLKKHFHKKHSHKKHGHDEHAH